MHWYHDISLVVHPNPGSRIQDVFDEAIRLANELHIQVRFTHNGRLQVVHEGDDSAERYKQWLSYNG